ncbi:MAG: hypothetical protein HZT40_00140 [Candidatus Thiothrix singaporensis]|uniref:Lipoprotein n=1 Tax=Candidatus Thiothrix singaporensis TaxID=2799669 RepID=A0A7L6AML5_9GAMM|nr:MAG: hypothetical protein HZT40_00140 [Candidatus Thiothrix singaporensis]
MKTFAALLCAGGLLGCHEPVAPDSGNGAGGVHIPSAREIATGKDQHFAEQLPILQARNPEAEARSAIQRGERYFLCGAGRGNTLPGVEAEVSTQMRNKCPVRCLDGVTDALYGENHRRYLTAALDYSARWNKAMLEACR